MKLRKFCCFVGISLIFLSASPANSQQTQYSNFIKLVQNFHEASSSLQFEMLQSIFLVGEAINVEPNIVKIKNISDSVNEKVRMFEQSSHEIQEFINKNESGLATAKEVIEKIKADSSAENIDKIKKFANSFNLFAKAASESEFTAYANEGWANSGITVNPDDLIYVDSKGGWKVSSSYDLVGWQGYVCNSSNTYNINKSAPLGALLFRVRGSSKPDGFNLNENKRGQVDSKGRLEFSINDSDQRNNEGQLDLKVVVLNGETFQSLLQTIQKLKENTKQ
jgi:hypothetical protein